MNIPSENINQYPTYNKRTLLKNLYEQPVKKFQKRNIIGYVHSSEPKLDKPKRPMTAFTRFHSPDRFDPLSSDNVKQYN